MNRAKQRGDQGSRVWCCKPRRVEELKRDGDILHFGSGWIDSVSASER